MRPPRYLIWLFPLLALAQAPYAVEGEVVYRGRFPLGSWEGRNPTARGEVLWDGVREAQGQVCVDQKAWDSGNTLRDEHTRSIFQAERYPRACLYLKALYPEGEALVAEGELEIRGVRRPVRILGVLRGEVYTGRFETRFSAFGLERPRFLFLEVEDRVEVLLRARVRGGTP